MKGKLAIKNLVIGVSRFITRRWRLVVLLIALLNVFFLAGLLSGYMPFDITSNHQSINTILKQPSINTADELSKGFFNQGENIDPTPGVLKTVGIEAYWNPSLTSKVSTTNWGFLQPGSQKSVTVYLYNEGYSPVTLSLSTSNWTPSTASAYLELTWNYNGQTISPNAQIQVTLTLTVSPDITGINNFNFDIIIVATEQV